LIALVIDVRSFVTEPRRIQRKSLTRSQKDQWQIRFRTHHRMLAEHDRRADAFACPTATFPLHDVTDVFARGATNRTLRSSLIVCRGKLCSR
jgi:hypothetical protein